MIWRAVKIVAAAIAGFIGLALFGVVVLVVAGNTGAGRAVIVQVIDTVSGGALQLQGLSGRFPGALHVVRLEMRDHDGTWLVVDNAELDWSPLRILTGALAIERLAAQRVAVARPPASSNSSSSGVPPMSILIDVLHIDRLELAAPVAGVPAAVEVNGSLHLVSAQRGDVALELARLDGLGRYKFAGDMGAGGDHVTIDAEEPAHGLMAELARLPDLGALAVSAQLVGPRDAEHLTVDLAAGPMRAKGQGTIDLMHQMINVDLTGNAPAMQPRADIAWQSASLDLHVHGGFTTPNAAGRLEIDKLTAGGGRVGQLAADVAGSAGKVDVTASLAGVTLPGPRPDIFAAAPIKLDAEAILDTPTRPVRFAISHPLLDVSGQADTGSKIDASVTANVPSLAPFAALAATDLEGHAAINATFARDNGTDRLDLNGTVTTTGGQVIAAKVLGSNATLTLTATAHGDDVTLDHAAIDGERIQLSAQGTRTNSALDFTWGMTLANVADLEPTLSGPLTVEGTLKGPGGDNLAVTLQSHGQITVAGLPGTGTIDASARVQGLPANPSGQIELHGQLANAPVTLAATAEQVTDGALHVVLQRAQWKSIDGTGDLTLPPGTMLPLGHLQFHAARLDDLAPLLGTKVAGSVNASLDTTQVNGQPQTQVHAEARQLAGYGGSADRVTLDATVKNPATHPVAAMQMVLTGIAGNGVTGNAKLDANGPQEALALRLTLDLATPRGPSHLVAAATAQLPDRELRLTALQADYGGETMRLLGPARFRFASGIAVDQLRIATGTSVLAVAGTIAPRLQLDASVRDATPALAKPFFPTLNATGTIAMDAKLGGTLAAPTGTVRVTGRGLRVQNAGAGGAFPATDIAATAELRGASAQLDAQVTAGTRLHLRVIGTIPLSAGMTGPINLRSSGVVDLAVLDPLLTAEGRSVHGQVTVDLAVAGTAAAPRASGTIRIANGAVQDYLQGIHITDIAGTITGENDTLRITQLTGKAGSGTVAISGTIAALQPDIPVELTITAQNARPLASDLLTATLDANITVRGTVAGALTVGGRIHVRRADIQIPDSLPQSVAVLDVRKRGQKPAPPPPAAAPIALDLTIDAPEQIFVRGHGLDAEMGGDLHLSGNSKTPQIGGGFDLRHGSFSLAGQSLNFTSGRVAFDGFGLASKLDPTINFVAESSANGVTATLTITGYADAPKIRLSSVPDLPQDEILAQLLFGQSTKQLSPFQLLSIAQAIAAISGVGGGTDPLASVRKGLGLDRLSVGAASGNTPGATLEAGKYVANGVYVGTKQGTSGGTQAQVQVDLTKHLKLESQLGTGGGVPATGVTPDNDPGSSVGLTWQLEY